jgi:hypothetical protein
MNEKEYNRLSKEEKKLNDQTKDLIIKTLKENNGRIKFVPEDEYDEYPISIVLYGKYDNPAIDISDVYLGKDDTIFADGINVESCLKEERFPIYPEQFSNVLHFIAAILGWVPETRKDETPNKESFEITVLFGSDVIYEYNDTGEIPSKKWLDENGGVIDTITFNSQKELDAYVKGLNDADGWMECLVLSDFMKNLMEDERKLSNKKQLSMNKTVLTDRKLHTCGNCYSAAMFIKKNFVNVVYCDYIETSSSAGDWTGLFIQKIEEKLYITLFYQENTYPSQEGYDIYFNNNVFTVKKGASKINDYKKLADDFAALIYVE